MSSLNDEDRENLAAYLDGELDEKTALELEAKLNRDPEARKEMEALRQAWSMLEFLPRPEPSPNFTNRTMERLTMGLPRGSPTARMHAQPRGRGLFGLGWAGAVLLALAAGAVVGSSLWRVRDLEEQITDVLAQHRRLIENFLLYEVIVDLKFLESLDHPDQFGAEVPAGDPEKKNEPDEKKPEPKPCVPPQLSEKQLRFCARSFIGLSAERREQLIKLDRELYAAELEPVRGRLLDVACRLRQWFDHLGAKERDKVMQQPDHARLAFVKDLRHLQRTWDLVQRTWELDRSHRRELSNINELPADVKDYYNDFLKFMLTPEEKQRLDNAEGAAFLKTLVELADRHPLALEGPRKFADVPKKVKDSLGVKAKLPKTKKETWPEFGSYLADLAAKKGVPLPYELWPINENRLLPPMQAFVAKLAMELTETERQTLRKASGKWPDYPRAIRDLSTIHNLQPPWFTLPGRERWATK